MKSQNRKSNFASSASNCWALPKLRDFKRREVVATLAQSCKTCCLLMKLPMISLKVVSRPCVLPMKAKTISCNKSIPLSPTCQVEIVVVTKKLTRLAWCASSLSWPLYLRIAPTKWLLVLFLMTLGRWSVLLSAIPMFLYAKLESVALESSGSFPTGRQLSPSTILSFWALPLTKKKRWRFAVKPCWLFQTGPCCIPQFSILSRLKERLSRLWTLSSKWWLIRAPVLLLLPLRLLLSYFSPDEFATAPWWLTCWSSSLTLQWKRPPPRKVRMSRKLEVRYASNRC